MKKFELLDALFNDYYKKNSKTVTLIVEGGTPEPELLVNSPTNYEAKGKYIENTYDNNLHLKAKPDIKIIGAYFTDDRGVRIKELGLVK